MKKLLLATAILAAVGTSPASARLQLSISAGGSIFTCFDGEASCDMSPLSNSLLTVDTTVGGAFVNLTLALSQTAPNVLQLSASDILNLSGKPITVTLLASDTGFVGPVKSIEESGSLTFNRAIGSGASMLQFWADAANVQGANPTNTPGTLLDTVTGTPISNPDSFSGTLTSVFAATGPFSMTEGASLKLTTGASITGFNQSMQSTIPEASTWAMLLIGFGSMALGVAFRKRLQYY